MREEIISEMKLDKKTISELKDFIKEKVSAEKVEIIKSIDENLVGGTVIKYGDKILDGCLKTRMRTLRSELIK